MFSQMSYFCRFDCIITKYSKTIIFAYNLVKLPFSQLQGALHQNQGAKHMIATHQFYKCVMHEKMMHRDQRLSAHLRSWYACECQVGVNNGASNRSNLRSN